MKTYTCPKCHEEKRYASPQAFGYHKRHCSPNGSAALPPPSIHNPLRHLDTALAEIDGRMTEIQTEIDKRNTLAAELARLTTQREYIVAAQRSIEKHTEDSDVVREVPARSI